MGVIYLVRHGQASFESADYDQLSELGEQQAQLVGQWAAQRGVEVSAMFSGELKRQQQSAARFLQGVGLQRPVQSLAGLNEFDHENILKVFLAQFSDPDLFEREVMQSTNPRQAFQQVFEKAIHRWASGQHDGEYRETWAQFNSRVMAALGQMVAHGMSLKTDKHKPVNLFAFTSAGAIASITKSLLHIPDEHSFGLNWVLVNSSVTKLVFSASGVTLASFNEQAHLEGNAPRHLGTHAHKPKGWITYR